MTKIEFQSSDHLLFQGDSITDCGRKESSDGLGYGYVAVVRAAIAHKLADLAIRVTNRGIGGDRSVELLDRWNTDTLELKPTVLSLMVGVNDVWRLKSEWNRQKYVGPTEFEANYRRLLDQALSNGVRSLVLMSPTTIDEEIDPDFAADLDVRMQIVQKLAGEYRAVYVPTREIFLRTLRLHPETDWTLDGCHPTIAGHGLIASLWLQSVGLTN